MAEAPPITPSQLQAIRDREPFDEGWLCGYTTKGGTYMVASSGRYTDSGQPRDLIAVMPAALDGRRVIPVWIAVNPATVEYLEKELSWPERITMGGDQHHSIWAKSGDR